MKIILTITKIILMIIIVERTVTIKMIATITIIIIMNEKLTKR